MPDIFLRPVPPDANPADVRLGDPAAADAPAEPEGQHCITQEVATYAGWPAGSLGAVFCENVCGGLVAEMQPVTMPAGSVLLHTWWEGSTATDCCAGDGDNTGGCCAQRLSSSLHAAVAVSGSGSGCECLNGFVLLVRGTDGHWRGCATLGTCSAPVCLNLFCESGHWRLIVTCGTDVLLDTIDAAVTCLPWLFGLNFSGEMAAKVNACCTALGQRTVTITISFPDVADAPLAQQAGLYLVERQQWSVPCVTLLDTNCLTVCGPCCTTPAYVSAEGCLNCGGTIPFSWPMACCTVPRFVSADITGWPAGSVTGWDTGNVSSPANDPVLEFTTGAVLFPGDAQAMSCFWYAVAVSGLGSGAVRFYYRAGMPGFSTAEIDLVAPGGVRIRWVSDPFAYTGACPFPIALNLVSDTTGSPTTPVTITVFPAG